MRIVKALIGPVIMLLLAAVLVIAGMVFAFANMMPAGQPFDGPGTTIIELERTGTLVIWHESKAIRNARVVRVADELPHGTTFTVRRVRDGQELSVTPTFSMHAESGQTRRVSVGTIEVDEPGAHEFTVTGLAEPRHFSVGESRIMQFVLGIWGFSCAAIVVGLAGVIWGVVALVRVLSHPTPAPKETP